MLKLVAGIRIRRGACRTGGHIALLCIWGFPQIVTAFVGTASPLRGAGRFDISMKQGSSDFKVPSSKTLAHYSQRAEAFWEGTKDHDVTQNREALLRNLLETTWEPGGKKTCFDILDIGCGPGRDIKAFAALGHNVTGLDGCSEFVAMAKALCPSATLLCQDLHALAIGDKAFDGVFANAVLFHVHRPELPRVMRELYTALRPRGILFVSNPRSMYSEDRESGGGVGGGGGDVDQRYGHYQTLESWRGTCASVGLEEVEHYYRPPGRPRDEQPWLASVWRRPA